MTLRECLQMPELNSKSPGSQITGVAGLPISPTIEYFFTSNKLLIFITRGTSINAISQDIDKEKLTMQVREFLESVRQQDAKKFIGIARTLYDELIVPIEKHIVADSSETLMILPDGPLHLLPFAGLQDRQGRFLVERMPIAYAPSRSVLQHCMVSGRNKASGNLRATLIDGSENLPNAQKELAFISQLYGRNASILSPGNLSVFKQAAADSEIIHFSGHAINVQGKPALFLQRSPREIYLDCQAISAWKMPRARFINLAGCSTATGPLSEGESPWGLIPAFLNAGAPAVIASLMPVDDASTEFLNRRFYELLQKGVGKAAALQKAQIALLNSARTGSDSNPQSWMPYILVGNPQ
jgi:CHAT domain-containing protein